MSCQRKKGKLKKTRENVRAKRRLTISSLAFCIHILVIYLKKNSYEYENHVNEKYKRKTEKTRDNVRAKRRLTITKGTILFNLYCQQSQKSNKGKNWVTKMQFN